MVLYQSIRGVSTISSVPSSAKISLKLCLRKINPIPRVQRGESSSRVAQLPQTLEAYAHQVIEEQYRRIIKQEKKVLADKDPEALHQMRVGTRRLRTALQVFDTAIEIPKAGSAQRVRDLARVLGEVRDLDVQMASLEQEYWPNLGKREQKQLDKVSDALKQQRLKAFAKMKTVLSQPLYQELKTTYADWLKRPRYTPIAKLPLSILLPDLLGPLLSDLLLHPGWLISWRHRLYSSIKVARHPVCTPNVHFLFTVIVEVKNAGMF